ncbi:hypothetical protein JMA_10830 [Jeotgalibacillus malaysiensis]|uniref:Uncharacterized protein n=1 Tax=Jeotgalibacillus malaysiensis TaxID=1508404 RepID=A0A0B5AJ82_9BACL|nr:hypothetical protein JMA_10830 [Jeotgalibacillus malaysiensis]
MTDETPQAKPRRRGWRHKTAHLLKSVPLKRKSTAYFNKAYF